jgi:hypothetical protein
MTFSRKRRTRFDVFRFGFFFGVERAIEGGVVYILAVVEEEVYVSSLAATQTQSHSYVREALLISTSFKFSFSFPGKLWKQTRAFCTGQDTSGMAITFGHTCIVIREKENRQLHPTF